MVLELPLTKANRMKLAAAFRLVPRVDFAINCVIEGQMGKGFVDDAEEPTVFKVEVGPFLYFAGAPEGSGGRSMLESIVPHTLLMPSSPGWTDAARGMYGERLASLDRYSFSSEHINAEHLERLGQASPFRSSVKQMDIPFVTQVWGRDHFVDISSFDSPEDFIERGIGFYSEKYGKVLGAAYSSLVCSKGIEVSLYVRNDYRRHGIASVLASHLLRWCIDNSALANWDAANPESCKLAEKLGYVQTGQYQAHYVREK